MLSNTSYDLILRALGLTTTIFNGTCNQMASKPGDGSGSKVRHGTMKTVMRPSRQSSQHNTHSVPVAEVLPQDLQKLVNKEEQDRMIYEDPWERTCGPLLREVFYRLSDVSCRRPLDKFDEQPPHHGTNLSSECLPPELQKMVDKEEADRLLYEDSWTRTLVHSRPYSGLIILLIMS